ncbi:MAG: AAA family ATPase [Methanomicrobia archaeon]|nr:AAA family ATPase [Methanomicrobia archaeon]RLF95777.1 MAG: cytidylate kinase [Thermococci archaeon]RLF96985.1 MAG: cytidylate kinase [Thermococci archaeon]HDN81433.1 cytidylate kinase [Methanomicrobia archaeon]HEC88829.1 cytidylate kinase [Thermoplasmata archaeon]
MKITIGGLPGSGTTTSARLIERNLGFKHIYAGLIFRELAEERGMSLEEFSKHAEGNRDIDNLIDRKQKELSGKYEKCIVEGRMAAYFVNADLKIWLTAPFDARAERIANRERKSLEESKKEIKMRERSEKKRYKKFYGIDIDDLSVYDLIINTDKWEPAGVYKIIKKAIEVKR